MYIKLFYIYRAAGQLLPIYPVYLLLFQSQGLSVSMISWLMVIWCMPGIFLEIPSSILADHWNRKNMLIIGKSLKASCFLVWSFANGFWGFALGFILWGIGSTLTSGTEEAWLFDALKAHNKDSDFDIIWGKSSYYYTISVSIISILGSVIAAYSLRITLWLSVCSLAVSISAAILMKEYNFYSRKVHTKKLKSYLLTLKNGFKFCLNQKIVFELLGINITVLVTAEIIDEYDQLIANSMGIPIILIGSWICLRYLIEAFGSRIAWRANRLLSKFNIKKPLSIQLLFGFTSGIVLLIVSFYPSLYSLPLYGLYYFLLSIAKVLFTSSLQNEIHNQGRATIQSFSTMLEMPSAIIIYLVFGLSSKVNDINTPLTFIAIWILLFCGLFQLKKTKK